MTHTLLLLASLTLAAPLVPADSGPDPYEGLYVCKGEWSSRVFWMGDWGGMDYTREFSVNGIDDYPYETTMRVESGGMYNTRGGFNDMQGGTDFEGRTFHHDDEPCTTVETVREMVTALGLEPADLAQEVMDLEGWDQAQTDARFDDSDYLHSLLNIEDRISHTLSSIAMGTLAD